MCGCLLALTYGQTKMIIQGLLASISAGGGTPPPPPQPSGLYAWEWDADNLSGSRISNTSFYGSGSTGYTSEVVNMSIANSWNTNNVVWYNGNGGQQIWPASSDSFMATSDFLQSPYSSSWSSSNRTGLTIELWFYPVNGARTLVSETGVGGPGSAGWHDSIIELNSNGTIVADIWPYTGGTITTGNSVNYNSWNHLIYTYNVSTTTLSIQLNGGTVVSNSSKPWESAAEGGGGGLYYAIGWADTLTNLSAGANTTNFDGRWGKVRIANYPMDSNYNSDWVKYNTFGITDSQTSIGASWTVEVVGDFHPSQYWATIWGNEVWNSGTGHLAYLTNSTNLAVGAPNVQCEYTVDMGTRAYWAFTHSDGGGIDVYRNGVLLTPVTNNYVQPSVASNTLLFGARHGGDGTGTTDLCPGNYLYTNISGSALPPATIASNFTTLQATYGLP